ncbi:MAG: glycosyltransferase family 39 protein [Lachnospiraceae bacterium]|nr:glycosyltransferase family 39 protein [Lachnospiraceae bacterium]
MPLWSSRSDKPNTDLVRLITYPVMALIGGLIFLWLTYHSFFYTQYIAISWEEKPLNIKDQPLWNVMALLAFAAVAFLLWLIQEKCSQKVKKGLEILAVCGAMLWILVLGLWWITTLDRVPEGDQAFIYGGASYFIEGNYGFFGHAGYCQTYPQQLGQIAVVELFFRIVGKFNYFAIELVCVFFAVGIVLLGYLILRALQAGFMTRMLYLLLMMGCIPLVCYTSWVYGDLPSTFFLFLTFYFILLLQKNPKWYMVAGVVASFTFACLVRKNSYIFLVAFLILAVIDAISLRRVRMLVTAALMLLVPWLCYQGIYAMYEARSGEEIGSGLPVNSWIAMGMQESWNGNGWYNNYPKEEAANLDWDYGAVKENMSEYLGERFSEFRANPGYARQFFKTKILSQWNEPLYQCLYFSKNYKQDQPPKAGSFLEQVYQNGMAFTALLFLADRWHFLIFLGLMFFFIFGVQRKQDPMTYLFAVTIIGGFFFTILWEAKARYVLPYYLMAFPMAVMGYASLLQRGKALIASRRSAGTDGK